MIQKLDRALWLAWSIIAVIILAAGFALLLLQVLSRYVFNIPLIWTSELASISFTWLVFWGAIGACGENSLVRMGLIYDQLDYRLKSWVDRIGAGVLIAVSVLAIPAYVDIFQRMWTFKQTITGISYSLSYLAGLTFFVAAIVISVVSLIQGSRGAKK